MSELPPANNTDVGLIEDASIVTPLSRLDSFKVRAGIVLSAGLFGAVEGTAVANYVYPPNISLAEGIDAKTSLTFHKGVDIASPITGQLDMPNVPVDTKVPSVDGIHTTISSLRLDISDPQAMSQYVGFGANFRGTVAEPISESIFHNLLHGAGIGAAIGAGAAAVGLAYLKHVRRDTALTQEEIDDYRERGTPKDLRAADRNEKKMHRGKVFRRAWATVGVAAAIAGAGYTYKSAHEVETAGDRPGTALDPTLVNLVPELEGATVAEGGGGDQINAIITAIKNLKEQADSSWQQAYENAVPAIETYFTHGGKEYVDNPNIVAVAHVSDLHCNLSNYSYYFGKILPLLNPDIVAVTGDTQTNSGTMFYEESCFPTLEEIVSNSAETNDKQVSLVNVNGNHDGGETVTNGTWTYNLAGDNNVAKVPLPEIHGTQSNLTFVGEPDPVHTTWKNIPPDVPSQQDAEAEIGTTIAETACEEQEKGNTVIAMAHEPIANYQAIVEGCAKFAFSGHYHHEQSVYKYVGQNGKTVLEHTGGSASGAGTKVSLYEAPEQDASMSIIYYDQANEEFVGSLTVTVHTDSSVTLSHQSLKNPPSNPDHEVTMQTYLNAHPQLKLFGDNTAANNAFSFVDHG